MVNPNPLLLLLPLLTLSLAFPTSSTSISTTTTNLEKRIHNLAPLNTRNDELKKPTGLSPELLKKYQEIAANSKERAAEKARVDEERADALAKLERKTDKNEKATPAKPPQRGLNPGLLAQAKLVGLQAKKVGPAKEITKAKKAAEPKTAEELKKEADREYALKKLEGKEGWTR